MDNKQISLFMEEHKVFAGSSILVVGFAVSICVYCISAAPFNRDRNHGDRHFDYGVDRRKRSFERT
jgi:amino acid permease